MPTKKAKKERKPKKAARKKAPQPKRQETIRPPWASYPDVMAPAEVRALIEARTVFQCDAHGNIEIDPETLLRSSLRGMGIWDDGILDRATHLLLGTKPQLKAPARPPKGMTTVGLIYKAAASCTALNPREKDTPRRIKDRWTQLLRKHAATYSHHLIRSRLAVCFTKEEAVELLCDAEEILPGHKDSVLAALRH
ncbi:MAG: hypothetical protein ACYSU0_01165 [Planctomycetota bacterium]|jgi:hypothetical protein